MLRELEQAVAELQSIQLEYERLRALHCGIFSEGECGPTRSEPGEHGRGDGDW